MRIRPPSQGEATPLRSAQSAAWVRSTTPMRWKVEVRWALTVRSLIPSRRAICLLARPWRTSAEHLGLARGELDTGGAAGVRLRACLQQLAGRPGVQRRLAAGGGADAVEQVLRLGVLEQVADRAGVQGGHDPLPVGERREHDDLQLVSPRRGRLHDPPGRLDAVDAGHLQVHQHHVRPVPGDDLDGLGAVLRGRHHLDAVVGAEQLLSPWRTIAWSSTSTTVIVSSLISSAPPVAPVSPRRVRR